MLVGRFTKDPELKYTQSGIAIVRFTLAVNRAFQNASGEKEADFVSCVAWRKQAENIANYLKKGSLAGVDGRIQTGSYEGQDGKRVYTTEVVADSTQFLEPKSASAHNNAPPAETNNQTEKQSYRNKPSYTRTEEDPFSSGSGPVEVSDDDLPF